MTNSKPMPRPLESISMQMRVPSIERVGASCLVLRWSLNDGLMRAWMVWYGVLVCVQLQMSGLSRTLHLCGWCCTNVDRSSHDGCLDKKNVPMLNNGEWATLEEVALTLAARSCAESRSWTRRLRFLDDGGRGQDKVSAPTSYK